MIIDELRLGLPIFGFDTIEAFELWLGEQPRTTHGIWVKLAKKGAPGLARADAVDAALCYGWIDGQAHPYDAKYWLTRFTPRRPESRWSQVNRTRVRKLIEQDRVKPAGLAEIKAARADGRWDAAYAPSSTAQPSPELQAALDASPQAAAAFAALKRADRYAVLHRIANLKTDSGRIRLITEVVVMLERGETNFAQRANRADLRSM